MNQTTAKARYQALVSRREPFLTRAREAAAITVPSVLPPAGHSASSPLPQPYQGFGAQASLTLANRVASALMPPGRSIMALTPRPEFLIETGQDSVPPDVDIALAKSQQIIDGEIERRNWRQATTLAAQLLVITGNCLEQVLGDNSIKTYRLDQYVVVRDPSGKLIEIVIEEMLSPEGLPEELRGMYDGDKSGTTNVPLYTHIKLVDGAYKVYQEFQDQKVPDSEGQFAPDVLPFNALRWAVVPGEDYGRGKVEEHIADFRHLDGLSKSLADGTSMASRNVTMIRPGAQGGLNLMRRVARANNGDHVVGNPEDVAMLQFQNIPGLQICKEAIMELRRELGQAFLLSSSVTRNAERVTATEVRMVAQEVDGIVGGVFSTLSKEQSLFRIRRLVFQMQNNKQLPEWPEEIIEPHILTGLEALGREAVTNSIMTAAQLMQGLPQQAQDYPKWSDLLKKLFVSLELPDAVKTEAEVQEDRQRQMAQQAEMNVAQAGGQAAAQAAVQNAAPPEQQ